MKYAAIALSLLLFAACPSRPHSAETTTLAPPQRDLPNNRVPAVAAPTVDVQLTEYAIKMPSSLAPARYTFNVVNAGKEEHRFVLNQPDGISLWFDEALKPGDSRPLVADLKPGTYNAYCPVDKHKAKGMSATLVVK